MKKWGQATFLFILLSIYLTLWGGKAFSAQRYYIYENEKYIVLNLHYNDILIRDIYFTKNIARVSIENKTDGSINYVLSVILVSSFNDIFVTQAVSVVLRRHEAKIFELKFPFKNYDIIISRVKKFKVSAKKDAKKVERAPKYWPKGKKGR